MRNTNIIVYKLELALIILTNLKLKIAKKKYKKKEIIKKQKAKAIAIKCYKNRRKISLLSEKKNYNINIINDDIDLD